VVEKVNCPDCKKGATEKSYKFHTDPGHGWLEVPKSEVLALEILPEISKYSYEGKDVYYLEEDSDAGIFIRALEATGKTFHYTDNYVEKTFIRDLPRIQ
jgi:hypothetical protein